MGTSFENLHSSLCGNEFCFLETSRKWVVNVFCDTNSLTVVIEMYEIFKLHKDVLLKNESYIGNNVDFRLISNGEILLTLTLNTIFNSSFI